MQIKNRTTAHLHGPAVLISGSENMVFWIQSPFDFMDFLKMLLRKGGQHSLRVWQSPLRWGQCFIIYAGLLRLNRAFGSVRQGALWPLYHDCWSVSFSICQRELRTKFEWSFHCLPLAPASSPLCFPQLLHCPPLVSFLTWDTLKTGESRDGASHCWMSAHGQRKTLDSLCSFLFWRRWQEHCYALCHNVGLACSAPVVKSEKQRVHCLCFLCLWTDNSLAGHACMYVCMVLTLGHKAQRNFPA